MTDNLPSSIWKYKIFCLTESIWKEQFIESINEPTAPTTCPTDAGHTVNAGSVDHINTFGHAMTMIDVGNKTQGAFKWRSIVLELKNNVGTGGDDETAIGYVKTLDVTYDEDVQVYSTQITAEEQHRDDEFCLLVAPQKVVGTLTADLTSGTNTLTVDSTAFLHVKMGFRIHVGTSPTGPFEDLGKCISKDNGTLTMTVKNNATSTYTAASPTYIAITVEYACVRFGPPQTFPGVGSDVLGGSLVPKNTIIRLVYTNHSGGAKKMYFYLNTTY